MKTKILVLTAFVAPLFAQSAHAYDWSVGGAAVTLLEPSYMPDQIAFQIDKGSTACPSGTWLMYLGQGLTAEARQQNIRASYATLIAAELTGKKVSIYGMNNCYIKNIHLFP